MKVQLWQEKITLFHVKGELDYHQQEKLFLHDVLEVELQVH